ncbi:exocyst complex subunit Sec15-like protein [Hesseltinella vesiculosa]|uniref:Exocyst complex component SEC15 n=1 Tax=Hesseltinella vesiculosa TaxID=101127 RepID=A0A1X2GDQ6_9FUNG|nr:exocyst complex subunit Sec15-like protein [Hesseltinella vesiculosa]
MGADDIAKNISWNDTTIKTSGLELTFSGALDDTENLEQIGPVIKQIIETGKQESVLDQLDSLIRKKDGEIERMCNAHYLEFVHAVDQLLKVRQDSIGLKTKITGVNQELQDTGKLVTERRREWMEARKVQQNVDEAILAVQTSLMVLELVNKADAQLEQHKYFSTLKTLGDLKHQRLQSISQYGFAKALNQTIPVRENIVKDEVTAELKGWLARVREISREIGSMAMQRMQDRQDRWRTKTADNPKLKHLQHHNVNSAIEMVINEGLEASMIDNINIDFEPLFRCIHIYNTLGLRQEFKTSYEEDRRAQANLALSAPIHLREGSFKAFETLLQDVVGFFMIEHIVLHSTTDFRSQSEVDSLWEMVTKKVINVVSDSLKGCRDPELFLRVKYCLLIFIQTLEAWTEEKEEMGQGFDYSVKPLQETLLALFQRYSELLIHEYSQVFEKIVEEDECMPMTVENENELQEVMQYTRFRPDREFLQRYGYPLRLPFSKVFPTCCRDVSAFVHQFYQFAEGFSQTHGEMDDILKKAVDSLLINKVNAILVKKLQSTNLSQIVQIIINIEYFESTCPDFEMLLMETRSFHRSGRIHLKATSIFKETRRRAEKRIFELVNAKLDEFLELSEYDWQTHDIQKQPSPNLQDLVTFLTNVTNAALLNLPESIKSLLYYDALDHLCNSMKVI